MLQIHVLKYKIEGHICAGEGGVSILRANPMQEFARAIAVVFHFLFKLFKHGCMELFPGEESKRFEKKKYDSNT